MNEHSPSVISRADEIMDDEDFDRRLGLLMAEAITAGDEAMIRDASLAIRGSERARRLCATVMAATEAQS